MRSGDQSLKYNRVRPDAKGPGAHFSRKVQVAATEGAAPCWSAGNANYALRAPQNYVVVDWQQEAGPQPTDIFGGQNDCNLFFFFYS